MSRPFRIIIAGDIVGSAGRDMVARVLVDYRRRVGGELLIANGENAAGGYGITPALVRELVAAGVDVITSGNHIWSKKELPPAWHAWPQLIRPANYPDGAPGHGYFIIETRIGKIGVTNLEGRVFMKPLPCPFQKADQLLAGPLAECAFTVLDMHAEATSEKQAIARYLDGRIGAVVGTHTHVQTADERILTGGTAYITDLGMTGASEGVIGFDETEVLHKFLTQRPGPMNSTDRVPELRGVVIDVDPATCRAIRIERLHLTHDGTIRSGPSVPVEQA